MWADRERVERRLNALIQDFLDSQERESGNDEIDLGTFALVGEVKWRLNSDEIKEVRRERERPDARYTPEADWEHTTWYRSSDRREWVNAGLFRRAMLIADGFYDKHGGADAE